MQAIELCIKRTERVLCNLFIQVKIIGLMREFHDGTSLRQYSGYMDLGYMLGYVFVEVLTEFLSIDHGPWNN